MVKHHEWKDQEWEDEEAYSECSILKDAFQYIKFIVPN